MANLPAQGEIVDCRCCPRLVVHLVAQILNGGAVFILHFADKIDECALGTPPVRASTSSLPGILTVIGTKYSARFNWKSLITASAIVQCFPSGPRSLSIS